MVGLQHLLGLVATITMLGGVVMMTDGQAWLGLGVVCVGVSAMGLGIGLARLELLRNDLRALRDKVDDLEQAMKKESSYR